MRTRKLIWFCCMTAAAASGPAMMLGESNAATSHRPDSVYLVREVVYNELHDHEAHGYWRYWIEKHSDKGTQLQEQVETKDGPVTRVKLANGHELSTEAREQEERKLARLMTSASEQAQHRKDYAEDEKRIGRIVALLPEAFLYEPAEYVARSEAMPECACYHMHFRPNPTYPAHSIEARIFHAMSGDLWISVDQKRMVRLDGKLQENVDFGYGILGRLNRDGWFRLERTQVGESGRGDWKTKRLEIHMNGRAMLFKTIARETSEVRGGFEPVASGLSLEQAAALVGREPETVPGAHTVALMTAR